MDKRANHAPHPSVIIRQEMNERGWTARDVASRMRGVLPVNVLVLVLYETLGPKQTNLRIGADMAADLGEVFDVSPQFFLELETAWLAAHGIERVEPEATPDA